MRKEAALIVTGVTGLVLGLLAVYGVNVTEADASLLTQVIAFVVPLILNLIAGAGTRSQVYSKDSVENERRRHGDRMKGDRIGRVQEVEADPENEVGQ